jgi:hypothetical protein
MHLHRHADLSAAIAKIATANEPMLADKMAAAPEPLGRPTE